MKLIFKIIATVLAMLVIMISVSCKKTPASSENNSTYISESKIETVEVESEDTSSESEIETGSTEESTSNKMLVYADKDGNTYELIRVVTDIEDRELVILYNLKNKSVLLAMKNYFDANFHLVEDY